jgi:hypothetical protein
LCPEAKYQWDTNKQKIDRYIHSEEMIAHIFNFKRSDCPDMSHQSPAKVEKRLLNATLSSKSSSGSVYTQPLSDFVTRLAP